MKTMPTATLQLNIVPRRMLTKNEAAAHCGRPPKRFEIECPVKPLKFPNGDQRYDVAIVRAGDWHRFRAAGLFEDRQRICD